MGNRSKGGKYLAASINRFWTERKSTATQLAVLAGLGVIIALTTIWPKLQVATYAGLIFVMLPLVSFVPAVRPIFFLDNKWKLALVLTMLVILSYAIASIFEIVVETSYAGISTDVFFNPWGAYDFMANPLYAMNMTPKTFGKIVFCFVLSAPMAATVLYCTGQELDGKNSWKFVQGFLWSIVFLSVFGLVLRSATALFLQWRVLDLVVENQLFNRFFTRLFDNMREHAVYHYQAFSFLFITVLAYFIWMAAIRPSRRYLSGRIRFNPGALFYVLVLKAIFTLLMGVVVFIINLRFPDKDLPALPVFLLVYTIVFALVRIDHYFVLKRDESVGEERDALLREQKSDLFEAVKNRFEKHCGESGAVVLLNLSGGGIQAASWSVEVLHAIRDQLNKDGSGLGDNFFNSILSISSASGGSVGSMFFLNQLKRRGAEKYKAELVEEAANNDVLDVAGWGITFLDVWRLPISLLIGLRLLPKRFRHRDRGWALEREWDHFVTDKGWDKEVPRLSDWREAILEGDIPIPIFQSTIANEGRLMLISPISLYNVSRYFPDVVDFRSRFHGFTMKLSTAARLSATFPYISPICRSDTKDRSMQLRRKQEIYAADGGYFENYGVFTSVQLLDHLLRQREDIGIRKVLVLSVEAFPNRMTQRMRKASLRQGLSMAFLGPMKAISGALFKAQKAKNQGLLRLISSSGYFENIDIQYLTIPFPRIKKKKNGRIYSPPLSWKLTKAQRAMNKRAVNHIETTDLDRDCHFQDVVSLWQYWHQDQKNAPEVPEN